MGDTQSRLQGVPVIVDTMGGLNLHMGNYEYTPHDRPWDAVSLSGPLNWAAELPASPAAGWRVDRGTQGALGTGRGR